MGYPRRLTEAGLLSGKYLLTEMKTKSYPKRTEQNILDSEGTASSPMGRLSGGSKLTANLAQKHGRPYIHIDLNSDTESEAAKKLQEWAKEFNIEILNVTGSRASKDPKIYGAVLEIFKILFGKF